MDFFAKVGTSSLGFFLYQIVSILHILSKELCSERGHVGEAKNRKARDSFYGRYPKQGKGLVISNPLQVNKGGDLHIKSSDLDPQELRRNLLFWDKLVWPRSQGISISGSRPEVEFLSGEGILTRPEISMGRGGLAGEILGRAFIDTFVSREQNEPGIWSLSEGPESLILEMANAKPSRGTLVKLYRAIPIPDKDVPLEDICALKKNVGMRFLN